METNLKLDIRTFYKIKIKRLKTWSNNRGQNGLFWFPQFNISFFFIIGFVYLEIWVSRGSHGYNHMVELTRYGTSCVLKECWLP